MEYSIPERYDIIKKSIINKKGDIPIEDKNDIVIDLHYAIDKLSIIKFISKNIRKLNLNFRNGDSSLLIAAEECVELAQEIYKYILKYGNEKELLEEYADVKISLMYLNTILQIKEKHMESIIDTKLNRVFKRMIERSEHNEIQN